MADKVKAKLGAKQRIRADTTRDLDLALGNQRTRHRRAEQVLAVVNGAGAERRENEVGNEFRPKIFDETLLGA